MKRKKEPKLFAELKSVASSTFSTLLDLAQESSTAFAQYHQYNPYRQQVSDKCLSGLIIETEGNSDWTQAITTRLRPELETYMPGIEIDFLTITVSGDETDMYSALVSHPALTGGDKERFSFVITPGYTALRMVHEIREEFGLDIVQLYCVEDAFNFRFVQQDHGFSGVYNTPMAGGEYADALRAFIPDIKRACMVSTPRRLVDGRHAIIEEQRKRITHALCTDGIEVENHFWTYHEIHEGTLLEKLRDADVLITLDEPAVYRHCRALAQLCDSEQRIFCASELDSLFKGAALGGGVTKDAYIGLMAIVLHELLITSGIVNARCIPLQIGMRYNMRALERQGVQLTRTLKALLRLKSMHDRDCIRYAGSVE